MANMRISGALALTVALSGCVSVPRMSGEIKDAVEAQKQAGQEAAQATARAFQPRRRAVEHVGSPFIAARSAPQDEHSQLPVEFSQRHTLLGEDRTLSAFAERISQITGMRVIIAPDVGRSAAGGSQGGVSEGGPVLVRGEYVDERLDAILDAVTTRAQVSWDYAAADHAIVIKRFLTRHFVMRLLPGDATLNATSALGGVNSGVGGASGGNSNSGPGGSQTVAQQASYKPREELEKQIKALLSPGGSLVISDVSNTITVTDTRNNLRAIERLIDSENRVASRQVVVRMQLVGLTTSEQRDLGLDLQTAFKKIGGAGELIGGTIGSPASLVSSLAGVMKFDWSVESGRTTQSAGAVINALAQVGNVRVVQDRVVTTFHNRAVPFANTEQVNYLARITPAPAGGSGLGSGVPGLESGTVNTGFSMVVRPTILDDNRVLLNLNVVNSRLVRMDKATAGTGNNALSIQTPSVSSTAFEQQIGMQSGQTILISAYDAERDLSDRRGLVPGETVGVGASFSGTRTREHFFVMLTPVILDI